MIVINDEYAQRGKKKEEQEPVAGELAAAKKK